MAYQHPLHYLLGLEGLALLRAFGGDHDREFAEARLAEIRRLLSDPALTGDGVDAAMVDTVGGYQVWAQTYDEPGNGLFPAEEPFVHRIVAVAGAHGGRGAAADPGVPASAHRLPHRRAPRRPAVAGRRGAVRAPHRRRRGCARRTGSRG
jgi:hypothetical protein